MSELNKLYYYYYYVTWGMAKACNGSPSCVRKNRGRENWNRKACFIINTRIQNTLRIKQDKVWHDRGKEGILLTWKNENIINPRSLHTPRKSAETVSQAMEFQRISYVQYIYARYWHNNLEVVTTCLRVFQDIKHISWLNSTKVVENFVSENEIGSQKMSV